MQLITGNTFPVRSHLKALGGTWSPAQHGWRVPDRVADRARQLVAQAATGYREPVGFSAAAQVAPCWECHAPDGRFRNYGAATPVLCDVCHERRRANQAFTVAPCKTE